MGPRPCAVFLVAPLAFRAPRGVLLGRAAWCARGRWPAREPSAPRAFGSARRLEARPGPATAHGHRSQAHGSLRRPPCRWRLRCCVVPARPRHRPRAPQSGPRVPPAPSTPVAPSVLCGAVQAPPPPTGTAARPTGPSGALHIGGDWHAGVCLGALSRSPPVPSGPSGALHTCGAWSLCVPVGGDPPVSRPRRELRSARRLVVRPGPAAHRHRGVTRCPQVSCPALACRIAEPTLNFARNSLAALSNHELRSLELQRFQTLLNVHTIELRAIFVGGAAVTDECCGQVLGFPADRYRGLVPPL